MKSGGLGAVPSYGVPAKRRWRGLVIAVLGLVILSMLVPLVFLLGLHNGFHSSGTISPRSLSSLLTLFRYSTFSFRARSAPIKPSISLSSLSSSFATLQYALDLTASATAKKRRRRISACF